MDCIWNHPYLSPIRIQTRRNCFSSLHVRWLISLSVGYGFSMYRLRSSSWTAHVSVLLLSSHMKQIGSQHDHRLDISLAMLQLSSLDIGHKAFSSTLRRRMVTLGTRLGCKDPRLAPVKNLRRKSDRRPVLKKCSRSGLRSSCQRHSAACTIVFSSICLSTSPRCYAKPCLSRCRPASKQPPWECCLPDAKPEESKLTESPYLI